MFAPDLHVHSHYSILDGQGSPSDVVKAGKRLNWGAVALTEHGWLGSAIPLYKAAQAEKIKPIIGCEFYIVSNDMLGVRSPEARFESFHLTVLALSAEGYHNLVAWTTFSHRPENYYYKPRISIEAMEAVAPYGLHHNVVLSGCLGGELCGAMANINGTAFAVGESYIEAMKTLFPNFYIELQRHRRNKFMEKGFTAYEEMVVKEDLVREKLLALSARTGTPTVLTNDSHFQEASQRKQHVGMIASSFRSREAGAHGNSTEHKIRAYLPHYGYMASYMQPMEAIADKLPGRTGEDAIANVLAIVDEVDIRLKPLDEFSYSIPFSGYKDPIAKIRKISSRRLNELVRKHGPEARERFEFELESMGDFAHYLILMSYFIREANKRGILTNTRGSAANSLLCYCLEIHDIDPMPDAYDLLFERFYNPSRKKLPDIDIDIEKDRYEDFMRIVIERMDELEGEGQVIPICNLGTLANRSAFRLIADALEVPKETQDEIAKLLPQMIDSGMVDEDNDAYEALKDEFPDLYELAAGVFDAPKNISQHACGWIFGTKDRPLSEWVPIALIPSSGSLVTQFNMKSLEELGLNKGDFLRLKTLSVISRCRKLLGQNALDISDIPLDDPETFRMLREGRTEGIFTLQGKENRKGVMECEVETVDDVIRSVAIYRPALTRDGLHHLYNKRRKGEETVNYLHPLERKILGPTHGVPVFQEQVLQLARAFGATDLNPYLDAIKKAKGVGRGAAEAFEEIRPIFLAHAVKVKHKVKVTREIANGVWTRISNSAGYGFNKGHATSYGRLAVRAAYLCCHHPAEFFTALLDVYPEKARYVAAARSEGFEFLPPDVNRSTAGFSLDDGAIRVGLGRVKGVGPVGFQAIVSGQPFSSWDDFRSRVSKTAVKQPTAETLAALGFFASIGIESLPISVGRDVLEFQTLGFTIHKPIALKGFKPKARTGSKNGWTNLGLVKGVELTEYKTTASKRFWIPGIEDEGKFKLLDLKASPWAQVKTYLLTAVDENGLAFHLMANEDKEGEVGILKYLARYYRGACICADGAIRQPFLSDGPMGFRFYGISGAGWGDDPQVKCATEKQHSRLGVLSQMHNLKSELSRARRAREEANAT